MSLVLGKFCAADDSIEAPDYGAKKVFYGRRRIEDPSDVISKKQTLHERKIATEYSLASFENKSKSCLAR